ncbi:MAG: DUF4386 family protein [Chloroflexi bacterium]|nr:DUF4386 family protein [Chloroflexota bacterium]
MNDIRRVAGVSGIIFVVVLVGCFLATGTPPAIDDPDSDILKYLEDKRTAILWSQWGTFVSLLPALPFFGYFITQLRKAEGENLTLTMASVVALAVALGLVDVVAMLFGGAGFYAKHGLDESQARLIWDIAALGLAAQISALGIFGVISGWCIVAKRAFAAWVGWLGIAAGVLGIAGAACLASDGAFAPTAPLAVLPGIGGFALYSLVLAVLFLRPAKAT